MATAQGGAGQIEALRGQPNGYAQLDGDGNLPVNGIIINSGTLAGLTLDDYELGFATDTSQLLVGLGGEKLSVGESGFYEIHVAATNNPDTNETLLENAITQAEDLLVTLSKEGVNSVNGSIDNATTTLVVDDGSGFYPFDLIVVGTDGAGSGAFDDTTFSGEWMLVTAVNGNSLTVTRGRRGSAVAVANNADIYRIRDRVQIVAHPGRYRLNGGNVTIDINHIHLRGFGRSTVFYNEAADTTNPLFSFSAGDSEFGDFTVEVGYVLINPAATIVAQGRAGVEDVFVDDADTAGTVIQASVRITVAGPTAYARRVHGVDCAATLRVENGSLRECDMTFRDIANAGVDIAESAGFVNVVDCNLVSARAVVINGNNSDNVSLLRSLVFSTNVSSINSISFGSSPSNFKADGCQIYPGPGTLSSFGAIPINNISQVPEFTKHAVTLVNGARTDVETTLVVDDASSFRVGDVIQVDSDDELMRITAIATNTLTVVRAVQGHAQAIQDNDQVYLCVHEPGQARNLVHPGIYP